MAPSVDPALTRGVGPRDAVFANHLVVIDGLVVGGWRRVPGKRDMGVVPTLLRALSTGEKAGLASACEAYGRFLALPVTMTPPRRAGAKARSGPNVPNVPSTGRARARAAMSPAAPPTRPRNMSHCASQTSPWDPRNACPTSDATTYVDHHSMNS